MTGSTPYDGSWKSWAIAIPPAALLFILPFPGTVALRLLLLSICFVSAMAIWRNVDVPSSPGKLPILLWAAVAMASVPLSFDPAYSLGEVKNEIGYSMMAFLAFYALSTSVSEVQRISIGLGAGALALLVPAIFLQTGQRIWNEGTFVGGSGTFSTYLLTTLPIFLTMLLARGRKWSAAAAFIIFLVAGYLTGQKIYILVSFLQAAMVIWFLNQTGTMRTSKKIVVSAAIVGIVIVGAMMQQILANRAMTTDPLRDNVVQDVRVRQWPKIIQRIADQPLMGKGFGRNAMSQVYPDLTPPDMTLFWHAHNVFLNYGISMGLPGILALLILFASLLRAFWKLTVSGPSLQRAIGIAGFVMVAGVVARNLTNDFFMRDMSLLFWSLTGLMLGLGNRLQRDSGVAKT
jgi:O-antigen ligase